MVPRRGARCAYQVVMRCSFLWETRALHTINCKMLRIDTEGLKKVSKQVSEEGIADCVTSRLCVCAVCRLGHLCIHALLGARCCQRTGPAQTLGCLGGLVCLWIRRACICIVFASLGGVCWICHRSPPRTCHCAAGTQWKYLFENFVSRDTRVAMIALSPAGSGRCDVSV